jgi:hypothetical protein
MKIFKIIIIVLSTHLILGGPTKGSLKLGAARLWNTEPLSSFINTNTEISPIFNYNNRNAMFVTLVDSARNGYGLILANTRPLNVTDEGWIFGYRQWAGENETNGQIGVANSSDGLNWTAYSNLNPGMEQGRYPSSLGTPDYPYVFWNEYTGEGAGYGGRMYYSYDEFGWAGGSWSSPNELDNLWTGDKDQWVISPDHSYDEANNENVFNIVYDDWTRGNIWGMHSEAYFDGTIIFGNEFILFNEDSHFIGGMDESSFTSSGIIDINENGIGFSAVTAFFNDSLEDESPYANHHTLVLKMTEDYGATWTGGQGGSEYLYIPDEVFDYMVMAGDFNLIWNDYCFDEPLTISKPFLTYNFDLRVDSEGNPHIICGVIAKDEDHLYTDFLDNAFFHFTIEREHILNPGETQTETGWRYAKVLSTNNIWAWQNADGQSYWLDVFPSLAISQEDDDVLWVVTSVPIQGEFVVTDDAGTPEDSCDDLGLYPRWNEEVLVIKSVDGGASWCDPYNATNTIPDCWVSWVGEGGEVECEQSEYCTDGDTQDVPSELNAHAGTGATNNQVNLMFGRPDWCYGSTTGDQSGDNHKNRYYAGWVELDECIGDGDCHGPPGDVNFDYSLDILDIVAIAEYIVFGIAPFMPCLCDFNWDDSCDVLDIVKILNIILYQE